VVTPAAATGTLSSDAGAGSGPSRAGAAGVGAGHAGGPVRARDPHPGDQSPTTAPAAGGVARPRLARLATELLAAT
jgi:hypothetical protein